MKEIAIVVITLACYALIAYVVWTGFQMAPYAALGG